MAEPDPALEQALAAIAERPGDDAARRVFADLLLEKGDPRGEYLMLQFLIAENRGSPQLLQRANWLFRKHRRAWTKGLDPVLHQLEYRAGFPVEATFLPEPLHAHLDAALASPMMATLETLRQGGASTATMVKALTSPRLPLLTGAELRSRGVLAELSRLGAVVRLTRLIVRDDELAPLFSGQTFSGVRELTVPGERVSGEVLGRLLALPNLIRLVVSDGIEAHAADAAVQWPKSKLSTLELAPCFRYRREDGATVVALQGMSTPELLKQVGHVPKGTARIEIALNHGSQNARDPIELAFSAWPTRFIP